ncbi:ATP-binding cassette domain-containing protein [Arcanobacterium hippocoleae]
MNDSIQVNSIHNSDANSAAENSAVGNHETSSVLLQAVGVTKNFGMVHALAGIDLSIRKGEQVAIMGPSGSGKSTLLHTLSGILTPSSGRVSLTEPPSVPSAIAPVPESGCSISVSFSKTDSLYQS